MHAAQLSAPVLSAENNRVRRSLGIVVEIARCIDQHFFGHDADGPHRGLHVACSLGITLARIQRGHCRPSWLPGSPSASRPYVPSCVVFTVPIEAWKREPMEPDFTLLLDDSPPLVFCALMMFRSRPIAMRMSSSATTVLPLILVSRPLPIIILQELLKILLIPAIGSTLLQEIVNPTSLERDRSF